MPTLPNFSLASLGRDAVSVLMDDHRLIEECFRQYSREESPERSFPLIALICQRLRVHMEIEEDVFYPAFCDSDLPAAPHRADFIEHECIKRLIEDIENADPAGEYLEAMVEVLGRLTSNHIRIEEAAGGLFHAIRALELDLRGLAGQLSVRREELLQELTARPAPYWRLVHS